MIDKPKTRIIRLAEFTRRCQQLLAEVGDVPVHTEGCDCVGPCVGIDATCYRGVTSVTTWRDDNADESELTDNGGET